jgi:hypothetical protein
MHHDPFATVCLQHAPLRWLAARIRTTNPDLVGSLLFDDLSQMLDEYLQSVDAYVMPALHPYDADPAVREYVNAHWYLKRNLAELKAMDRRGDPFRKRLSAVMRQLEHQMAQEAAELPHLLHEREALVGASSASTHAYAHARL